MKQYSFLDTLLLVNGVEVSGFDEGDDVITVERLSDSAQHKIGTDGEMSVAISADRSGIFTFRLMQTSDSNAYLSTLVNLQDNGVFTPVFAQLKDIRGGDIGSGTQGYIQKQSGLSRGANVVAQGWIIVVERLDIIHGT